MILCDPVIPALWWEVSGSLPALIFLQYLLFSCLRTSEHFCSGQTLWLPWLCTWRNRSTVFWGTYQGWYKTYLATTEIHILTIQTMRTCWWKQTRRCENRDEGSMVSVWGGAVCHWPWGGGGQGAVTSRGESCWLCLCGLGQEALRRWCKQFTCNAEDAVDVGLIPGLGRSSGEGNGNPLQYFCLENPMDRGAWQATIHGVAKSQTQLSY